MSTIGADGQGGHWLPSMVRAAGVLLLTLGGVAIVYLLGIRSGNATVRAFARRYHHAIGNRLQMRSAGMVGGSAAVLRHRGRVTGRTYETPIWAVPTEDGFVIRIVYGPRTNWLRNVLANGTASIAFEGQNYPVGRPEIVPMRSAEAYFPPAIQWIDRLIRVDRALRLRRVDVARKEAFDEAA